MRWLHWYLIADGIFKLALVFWMWYTMKIQNMIIDWIKENT